MQSLIKKIASISLSLSILLASMGITLHENFCKTTGQKKVSFLIKQKNDCCLKTQHHSEDKKCKTHQHKRQKQDTCNHSQEKDCCDYEISYLKADLTTRFQQSIDFSFLQAFLPNPTFSFFQEKLITDSDTSFLFYTDTSPPSSGRKHIILKQSFLL